VVLAVSVALTALSWSSLRASIAIGGQVEHERRVHFVAEQLSRHLEGDDQLLRGLAGLLETGADPAPETWRRYVGALDLARNHPGLRGVGFGEASVGSGGDFRCVVRVVDPLDDTNRRALGYDMASEPLRRAALERARDTGLPALTAPVVLVFDLDGSREPGLVLYRPVYRRGAPTDGVEQRRAALRGVVYVTFRMRDLLSGALGPPPEGVVLDVRAESGGVLFDGEAMAGGRLPRGWRAARDHEERLSLFGQTWLLRLRTVEAGAGLLEPVDGVLAAGLLLSLLLFAAVLALARAHRRALGLIEALREVQERYASFFDTGPDPVVLVDAETGSFLAFNDRACQALGYSRAEFARLGVRDVQGAETPEETAARMRALLREGHGAFTTRHRDRSGNLREHHVMIRVTHVQGRPVFHSIWRDVTEQSRFEQVVASRLALVEAASSGSMGELLTRTLDEVEPLTGSVFGAVKRVTPDGHCVLEARSTRAVARFGRPPDGVSPYPELWAECARAQQPVTREGLTGDPGGIERLLLVPVLRGGRAVAVLGVANKPTPYTDGDAAVATRFADLAWEVAERKADRDRLQEADARLAAAFDRAPLMMSLHRLQDAAILDVNQRFVDATGFGPEELVGRNPVELGWLDAGDFALVRDDLLRAGRVVARELGARDRQGKPGRVRLWAETIEVRGEPCVLATALDVTREVAMREQLTQAQRLESVGRLAGGVAHDFNNILSVIQGHADMLLADLPADSPTREDLTEIRDASRRAALVTRQLLAFARRQAVAPQVLDLNDAVQGLLKMLRRLIGEEIVLAWRPGFELPRVRIDPSQVDQVLANLCVNARDAIEGPGHVEIRTDVVVLDPAFCEGREGLAPGRHVRLTVSDDGPGIPPEVLPHVFEPFFTTRAPGQGTGLGLATVYGIATQNHGAVEVESTPGEGATFHLYLPALDATAAGEEAGERATAPRGTETVLLVEDEAPVLRLCTTYLERLGYAVLAARDPDEALRVAREHRGGFQLLLTDVILPGKNGRELAEELRGLQPGLRCVFMSGYTSDVLARRGITEARALLLHKPFDQQELARALRAALGAAGAGG